jgi:hypothetical protein
MPTADHFRRIMTARQIGEESLIRASVQAAIEAGDSWRSIAAALGKTTLATKQEYGGA